MRFRIVLLVLCCLPFAVGSSVLYAAEPVAVDATPTSTLHAANGNEIFCAQEQQLFEQLQQANEELAQRYQLLDQLREGSLSVEQPIEEILGAINIDGKEPEATLPSAFEATITCSSLVAPYRETLTDYESLFEHAISTRQYMWLDLPLPIRLYIVELWDASRELYHRYRALSEALAQEGSPVATKAQVAAADVYEQLHHLRFELLRLIPALNQQVDSENSRAFFTAWQFSVEPGPTKPLPTEAEWATLTAESREAFRIYQVSVRHNILDQRFLLNQVRSHLWSLPEPTFRQVARDAAGGIDLLLRFELEAVLHRLDRIRSEFSTDYQLELSAEAIIAYAAKKLGVLVIGLLAAWLLVVIARASGHVFLNVHASLSETLRSRRAVLQITRLLSGLSMLMPWVIGWFGLNALFYLYTTYSVALLATLIPFARLFIVFGLLNVCGQWLVSRVAQSAGSFMNADDLKRLDIRARIASMVVLLPWLATDLVNLAIGSSQLADLFKGVREFTLFVGVGSLLKLRERDLSVALQAVLPARLDPWADRFLHPSLFVLTAPLTLVMLLPYFVMNFGHRMLLDFDWYRSVYAKGYRLQVAGSEQKSAEASQLSQQRLDHYAQLFDVSPTSGMPIVNNGLEDAIRSHLKPWLNDHSEENTLLLTGERGIGKSSALVKVDKYLENEFADCRRITLAIPPKTTDPTAVLQLLGDALGTDLADGPAALVRSDEDRQPTVLVLEDAHNFFLRRVGGLEGWETFLSLTNARLQNIFWLIVLNNQSYAYLNNVYRAEYRFRSVIRARPWSQTEIRSLILSRHTKSGLSIRYDDVLLASRGPEAGNVRNAEQRYFSLLWDACRGNPMMALCLWMTSVTVTHDAVLAALPSLLKSAGLDRSGEDFLFVYATLVIHENLTAGEIVETTSISDSSVRAALKQGVDGGFVVRDEYRRYRIVPIWYPMVCAQLMRKNLLHE